MKGNFVAKHAHKSNRCVVHKDKTKFDRAQLNLPAKQIGNTLYIDDNLMKEVEELCQESALRT